MRNFRRLAGIKNFFTILIVLSFSFVFISCGNGPMSKVGEPEIVIEAIDNGDLALNFGVAPPNTGPSAEVSYVALGRSIDSMADGEFTFEAWVKSPTAAVYSTIFARGNDGEGLQFFLGSSRPYFVLKYGDRGPCETPTYWVRTPDAYKVPVNTWEHIAVVFTKADHTGVHPTCIMTAAGYEDDYSHLDIYTDGQWRDCGPTGGREFPALATSSEFIGRSLTYGINYVLNNPPTCTSTNLPNTQDPGKIIIDDVRIWETARSADDINECYNRELGVGAGQCGSENPFLLSYWKLDEGPGETTITDSALHQNNGGLEYCDADCDFATAHNLLWDCDALAISNPGVLCTDPWVNNALGVTWQVP